MPSTGKRLNASWLWGFVLNMLVARRPFSFRHNLQNSQMLLMYTFATQEWEQLLLAKSIDYLRFGSCVGRTWNRMLSAFQRQSRRTARKNRLH
jgi:hypothetical protein